MAEEPAKANRMREARILLWVLVALALIGTAALLLVRRGSTPATNTAVASVGGPFTLVGADGKPFSSARLAGKPYAIFFGFTRCGDVCPTTLGRLAALRQQAGGERAFNIVFVTIDPANDGPAEVGQYATLFNSPIIGLTGSPEQIQQVKKQYGIFAEPNPHPTGPGDMMSHTSAVLLFDRNGQLAGLISATDSNETALGKLKAITA